MDPQERLFLEVAWETVEDAGYLPETLAGPDREVGVFVGAVWSQYQMLGVEESFKGNPVAPNSFHWSIANRVSYLMNLRGPSFSVDTACSSALTAIYQACESIRAGRCEVALAGGVNLDLHPSKRMIMEADKVLSRDGRCHSFGDDATGYVAGEGVGAVLLKPLRQAILDGDHIHGVIKGIGLNHDGHSNGFTVPNPETQAALIGRVLRESGVDARTIGYIEAHGTGTAMGDAIEVQALSEAFRAYDAPNASCPIGSVKTNIGHLEPASGMASIAKVLLQFKHRGLVASLHAATLSPFIEFEHCPFYVQRESAPWLPVEIDGEPHPLRAGVSTFGAGGANVHMILEAYQNKPSAPPANGVPELVVLSAVDRDRLNAYAARLKAFIERESRRPDAEATRLSDLAHTLRTGRTPLAARLALVVSSKEELWVRLARFLKGEEQIGGLYRGTVSGEFRIEGEPPRLSKTPLLIELERIAELWTRGYDPDWRRLFSSESGRRVSLPTYPFARERHWIPIRKDAVPKPKLAPRSEPSPPQTGPERSEPKPSALTPPTEPSPPQPLNFEERILGQLRGIVAELLRLPEAEIQIDRDLSEYDFDSLTGMKMIHRIKDLYGHKISIMSFFRYATIRDLFQYLVEEGVVREETAKPAANTVSDPDGSQGRRQLEKILLALKAGRITPDQAASLRRQISLSRKEVKA